MISADTNGAVTNYTYGLERISAVTDKLKTEYIYDGRGSVAAEVSYDSAWYTLGGAIAKKNVTVKSYTPFGEQIGEAVSGFGFNGEYYDALSGQVYLRARFYEPEMARFGQKDIVRGTITDALSLNRYSYCENDPVNFVDPSGMRMVIDIDAASVASKPKTTTTSTKTSNKPVQSHTSSVNPNNTAKVTSQAVADAKAAMDFANRTAPNSLQAQQARDAYQRTVNNAAIANATNNPSAARKAVETSKQAVNYANNSVNATGKPKTTMTSSNTTAPSPAAPSVLSPVQESGNCGAYGKGLIIIGGTEYSIYVPEYGAIYNYSEADKIVESRLFFNVNWSGVLAGQLEDFNGQDTHAGYYRVSDGRVSAPRGLWVGAIVNAINAVANNSDTISVSVVLQQNNNENRAIIIAKSTSAKQVYGSVCNDSQIYMNVSNTVFEIGAEELYKNISGNDVGFFENCEIALTYDSKHLDDDGAIAYLWYNEDGELIGTPIVYENDKVEVGKLNILGLFSDSVVVDTSFEDISMDIYSKAVNNVKENGR